MYNFVLNKRETIWPSFVIYFCYFCYSCYFCYEMKFLLFLLIFCYQMKCPGILKIYLSYFFSYTYYYCHTSLLKYTGLIWTTMYKDLPKFKFKTKILINPHSIDELREGSDLKIFVKIEIISTPWLRNFHFRNFR